MDKKRFYVYAYLRSRDSSNGSSGTPYYIGKGSGRRAVAKSCHLAPPPRERARIFIVADNLREDEAFRLEKALIEMFGRLDLGTGCLRNKTDGGDGWYGAICSAETRAKYSLVRKGRKLSAEHCKKLSEAHKGRIISEETREKLRTNCRHLHSAETLKKLSASHKGQPAWNKGKAWPDETRQKISAAKKGKPLSLEAKNKMKATVRAKNPNPSPSALRRRIWREKKAISADCVGRSVLPWLPAERSGTNA